MLLDLASEMGIDALCFVTLPFKSEGDKRKEIAYFALVEIRRKANATENVVLVLLTSTSIEFKNQTIDKTYALLHYVALHIFIEMVMGIVKISDALHEEVRKTSAVMERSINSQAEFWMKVGRLAEQNPKLSYEQIIDLEMRSQNVSSVRLVSE